MSHSVFISYSRRESPFVDGFIDALIGAGVEPWVDYRSLVPGKPWLEQIIDGIHRAEVFLMVVSKSSASSKNVGLECKHALEHGKRIILVIFEAASLPQELQQFEWVDFRSSFSKGVNDLLSLLDHPTQPSPPPQKGFKSPRIVWWNFILSLSAILISIPAWWTFYLPLLLVPLPYHILKRDFHFYRIRFAILTLPLILFLSAVFFGSYPAIMNFAITCCLISFILSPALLLSLTSQGMRLWGKPIATAPRFARPYQSSGEQPAPVKFFIEYAPEDQKYAEAVSEGLSSYGHPQVGAAEEAQASFVILSMHKTSTSIDIQKHIVYPILIQDAEIEDASIQKIQWIDFRRGIRNLPQLAELLPEPEKLLKALGVAPISGQVMYPRIIQMLDYFLTLLAFFTIGTWIPILLEFHREFMQMSGWPFHLLVNLFLLVWTLRVLFTARRRLVSREGNKATLRGLVMSFVGFTVLVAIQLSYFLIAFSAITAAVPSANTRGTVSLFVPFSCVLGAVILGFLSLWNWKDLTRWFPVPKS